ncbi:MAG TPA: hypothetical protein VI757_08325 [Bacteroidia bacterium]|nr:hypothetical protein [Bacteroidia bacterium]
MKTGFYVAAIFAAFALYSCEKDDDTPSSGGSPAPNSNNQVLTSHYWRLAYIHGVITMNMDTDNVLDTIYVEDPADSCEADDRYYFQNNNFLVRDPFLISCAEPLDSVSWLLINNGTQIIVDADTFDMYNVSSSQFSFGRSIFNASPYYLERDTLMFVYP